MRSITAFQLPTSLHPRYSISAPTTAPHSIPASPFIRPSFAPPARFSSWKSSRLDPKPSSHGTPTRAFSAVHKAKMSSSTMKAVQYIENSDDLSAAKFVEVLAPSAQPGCALIKVAAAAVNPVDWKVMAGYLKGAGWAMPLPFIMGYDISGVITEVGEGVTAFNVGDEVFCVNWGQGKHDDEGNPVGGAFAELVSVPASKLSKKPKELSHEVAAACALVGTTAYDCLFKCAELEKGQRVLVLGGASAVGSIAIQLAKNAGAWVAATHSDRNLEYVKAFNAVDELINYKQKAWEDELKDIDAVIDCVGEKGGFARAKKVLKPEGAFVTISSADVGFDPKGHPPLKYAAFYCLANSPEVQDGLASMIVAGRLKVIVESTYPFTEEGVQAILIKQKSGAACGKQVLKLN